jgi:uncharacterized protein
VRSSLHDKLTLFHKTLSAYSQVGVAFSGGVDSSFLLKSALDVLGEDNVVVLHARSCLQKKEEQRSADSWLGRHGYPGNSVRFLTIDFQPLSWSKIADNNEDRCYQCKLRMYSFFLDRLASLHISVLLDGTNTDDCQQHRPGLQAIRELGIQTPLEQSGLGKDDIRVLSRMLDVDTYSLPSSSCLATRIPPGIPITRQRLQRIALWEHGLASLGYIGCRVRIVDPSEQVLDVQFLKEDLQKLQKCHLLETVFAFFKQNGIEHVHINPIGR